MSTMKNKEEMGLLDLTNEQLTQVTGGNGCEHHWEHHCEHRDWDSWCGDRETSISVDVNVVIDINSYSRRCGW
ncbi:hypothetical protein [Dictyobacter aurantiacus]|uniref:Uncharacterized protein n=1 Tax=Dictyobacter aurantiacus TaxID=1936993 RepID=A0A401ZRW6_9CHLR|nr:hypothetical protein [Dictyobacter aurantiacus]GCE09593.1 hypothetical protein KDAU_69220 [Dictyobacter aurantiacus]